MKKIWTIAVLILAISLCPAGCSGAAKSEDSEAVLPEETETKSEPAFQEKRDAIDKYLISTDDDPADIEQFLSIAYDRTDYDIPVPYSIFKEDGWEESYRTDASLCLINEKYPHASLTISSVRAHEQISETILNKTGVYAFNIMVSSDNTDIPPFSMHGVSIGDDASEITETFGAPQSITVSDDMTYCSYLYNTTGIEVNGQKWRATVTFRFAYDGTIRGISMYLTKTWI